MKKVVCATIIQDIRKRDNLCQCVRNLGGTPVCNGHCVCVEYSGENADKLIELFENYSLREIRITDKGGGSSDILDSD